MPSSGVETLRPGTKLSSRKKLGFTVATVAVFFVTLEIALTLIGFEPLDDLQDPFVGFSDEFPLFTEQSAADGSIEMVTAKNKLAWFNMQRFKRQKREETVRIFCVGGSTTYGRPYDDATSFAGWLRELLAEAAPQTQWEVINAGGISYASYRVASLMQELADYEPDVFVIYTGHNEFLEERTYADIRDMPHLRKRAMGQLSRLKTFAMLNRLIHHGSSVTTRFELKPEVDAILDHTVGPSSYQRDDQLTSRVLDHFELNLRRVIQIARRAGSTVVLVAPASNLRDCSPFKSQHSPGLTKSQFLNWQMLYDAARELEVEGRNAAALAKYQKAARLNDRFAEGHYRIGRVLMSLERMPEARESFQRALTEDVCQLRALPQIGKSIRNVTQELAVPLVDFSGLLQQRCQTQQGHNLLGREYFLDHVHPRIEVNGWLAEAVVSEIAKLNEGQTLNEISRVEFERVQTRITAKIDQRKHAEALRNLAKVLNWAGKHREAGALALEAVRHLPDDPETLVMSAAFLRQTGRIPQAIANFRRAIELRPDYAEAYQLLGAMLVDAGNLDEARQHFKKLMALKPDDSKAWQMVGAIYAEQGNLDAAVEHYQEAARLNPNDANVQYNLGFAFQRLQKVRLAIEHYRRALELNSEDVDAHNNLGILLLDAGNESAAASHFREILRLEPENVLARENLDRATLKSGDGAAK